MKKLLFFAAVVVLLGSSSCKKNWTCTCNQVGNSSGIPSQVSGTKSQATSQCNDQQTSLNTGNSGVQWTCSL